MIKVLRQLLALIAIIGLLTNCTSRSSSAPEQGTANLSAGAIIKSVRINSAWSSPTTLVETTSSEPFAGRNISLIPDENGSFFAAWKMSAKQAEFAKRPSLGTAWEIAGPGIVDFNSVFSPKLYSNPQSNTVFATWYSPDHGLGTHYISRYTPDIGWTSPLAFADAKVEPWTYSSKVIVDANSEAILFWQTQAENGTVELHARRFDSNGEFSLMETLIIGQPGRLTELELLNAWITATGDVELYWVDYETQSTVSEIPLVTIQLWHSTYSSTGIGSETWSTPQKIPNGRFEQNNVINQLDVIATGNDNVLVIFGSIGSGENEMPRSLEYKSGVWGELTPIIANPPHMFMSSVTHNAQGQIAFVWIENVLSSTPEVRVFVTQYNPNTGWIPPVQVNASSQASPNSGGATTGDEPKISLNAAGQIAVTWINLLEEPRNLYTNFYDPTTGWQGEKLAVASNLSMQEFLGFNIALTDSGDVSLLWQEAEISADGNTTVRIQSTDHVGAGNGVTNVIKTQSVEPTPAINNGFGLRTQRTTPNRIIQPSLTRQQRIANIIAAANPRPIRLSRAWDEPTVIDVVTSPSSEGQFWDALHLIANDQGESTVYFVIHAQSSTSADPTYYIWGGDVLSGGWQTESLPSSRVDPSLTYISDLEIDTLTGDAYLAGGVMCPNENGCADLYVSRKPVGGTWEPPVFLAKNARSLVDLVVNSTSIGAVWAASTDTLYNLAYAEYHQDTGWSASDLFSPVIKPNAINPLSHALLSWFTAVLGESGVVSLIYHQPLTILIF